MRALKQSRTSQFTLPLLAAMAVTCMLAYGGCAGVKPNATTGTGGTGLTGLGGSGPPPINGLESLDVNPKQASVTLMPGAAGNLTSTPQQFTATGVVNGVSMDVSQQVTWFVDLKGVNVIAGLATATAPGIYTITAKSGTFQSSATLTATFSARSSIPTSTRPTTTRPCSTRCRRGRHRSPTRSTRRCSRAT